MKTIIIDNVAVPVMKVGDKYIVQSTLYFPKLDKGLDWDDLEETRDLGECYVSPKAESVTFFIDDPYV